MKCMTSITTSVIIYIFITDESQTFVPGSPGSPGDPVSPPGPIGPTGPYTDGTLMIHEPSLDIIQLYRESWRSLPASRPHLTRLSWRPLSTRQSTTRKNISWHAVSRGCEGWSMQNHLPLVLGLPRLQVVQGHLGNQGDLVLPTEYMYTIHGTKMQHNSLVLVYTKVYGAKYLLSVTCFT